MKRDISKYVEQLKAYLNRIESRREQDEPLNRNAYASARELGSILSLYEHGNLKVSKQMEKFIIKIIGG